MSIPTIQLNGTFTVILCNPPENISLSPALLRVEDYIRGGATRHVMIKYAISNDNRTTYLQTDKELRTTEFEEMFFLEPLKFIKGRTISLSSNNVKILKDI